MFSSGSTMNNGNTLPPLPPPPFLGHDDMNDIFAQHRRQDLITSGHFFSAAINVPSAFENNAIYSQDHVNNLLPSRRIEKTVHVNKAKHCKIVTAQGPRDRRVRLSIQIARKFFDLQDTLGFDRASKTLDWLFTKSKSSIDELFKMKKHSCCTTADAAAIDQEKIIEAAEIRDTCLMRKKSLTSSTSVTKEKNISRKQKQKFTVPLLARVSRAKARERARERTREKMSIRKLNESLKLLHDFGHPIPQNYSNSWSQLSSHNNSMVPYFKLLNSKHVSISSRNVEENWDTSNSFMQGKPPTADFQNCGKLGDVYGQQIMSQDKFVV